MAAFTLAKTATKGRGLYAARSLFAGETVLRERALVNLSAADFEAPGVSRFSKLGFNFVTQTLERPDESTQMWQNMGKLAFARLPADAYEEEWDILSHRTVEGGLCLSQREFKEDVLPLDLFQRILGALHLNTFSISEANTGDQLGSALFTEGSMFNHSCLPNVSLQPGPLHGGIGTFKLLRDVDVGEELAVSYIDHDLLNSAAERQQHLEWAYGFKCDCTACTAG